VSETAKGLIGWAVLLAIIGGGWFYWSQQKKPKSAPAAQAAKPSWALEKYDSGKFYFREDFVTEYRAVCESDDCASLLDKTEVGLLGQLDDVKRESLHLTVRQKGREYRFKVEAMGMHISHNDSTQGDDASDDTQ
jgi:hypothetical protein